MFLRTISAIFWLCIGGRAGPDARQTQSGDHRIAFGSCANQEREQPIWGAITAYKTETLHFFAETMSMAIF